MSEELEDFENQEPEISDKDRIEQLERRVESLNKENISLRQELNKRYSVFYPKSKNGLQADYPEFKKVREFQNVSKQDLLFVWYYACEGSPFSGIDDEKKRIKLSMDEAYVKISISQQERFLAKNFPEKVKIAIGKMRAFRVGPRVMAKRMMENTLRNWRAITDIDASDDTHFLGKDGVDWAKKKAFVETGANISKNIGTIIAQVEGSYSVSEKQDEKDIADFDNLIEDFHDSID